MDETLLDWKIKPWEIFGLLYFAERQLGMGLRPVYPQITQFFFFILLLLNSYKIVTYVKHMFQAVATSKADHAKILSPSDFLCLRVKFDPIINVYNVKWYHGTEPVS